MTDEVDNASESHGLTIRRIRQPDHSGQVKSWGGQSSQACRPNDNHDFTYVGLAHICEMGSSLNVSSGHFGDYSVNVNI